MLPICKGLILLKWHVHMRGSRMAVTGFLFKRNINTYSLSKWLILRPNLNKDVHDNRSQIYFLKTYKNKDCRLLACDIDP
jgi:hypothetical protein